MAGTLLGDLLLGVLLALQLGLVMIFLEYTAKSASRLWRRSALDGDTDRYLSAELAPTDLPAGLFVTLVAGVTSWSSLSWARLKEEVSFAAVICFPVVALRKRDLDREFDCEVFLRPAATSLPERLMVPEDAALVDLRKVADFLSFLVPAAASSDLDRSF